MPARSERLRLQVQDNGGNMRSSVEMFLRGHGDATDAEDRVIVDYLRAQP